ncbi:MAG TPA: SAM-dependent chlorinase/fluorinase [Thermoanaerobaculia bacterium]|nr:SAM-dependent chlorinase/fluorinase [Thermoanaerobaculia bacterium]
MRRIALMTDFGRRDPYVASVRGVLASRCDARVDDLTHEIAPFDVFEAAWFLSIAAPWWPAETIFVCVIDPGVGTPRRILAAEHDGKFFLAPDNGLLTFLAPERVISVESASFFLQTDATTFHGRDRFAPVAAAIATGTRLEELGPLVNDAMRLAYTPPVYRDDVVRGTIVHIDHFGNVITDIARAQIPFDRFAMRVHYATIKDLRTDYGGGHEPFLIVGSTGMVEISVGSANAADMLHLKRGDQVEITRAPL